MTIAPTPAPPTPAPDTGVPVTLMPPPGPTPAPRTFVPETLQPVVAVTVAPTPLATPTPATVATLIPDAAFRTPAPQYAPHTPFPLAVKQKYCSADDITVSTFNFMTNQKAMGCVHGGQVLVGDACIILVHNKDCKNAKCLPTGKWSPSPCSGANAVDPAVKDFVTKYAISPTKGPATALMANIDCKVEDLDLASAEPLDWEFHPIGVPLGSHANRYFIGAVVFNYILLLGLGVLLVILARVQMYTGQINFLHALANMRTPGILYVPFFFLMPGLSLSSAHMAFNSHKAPPEVAVFGWLNLLMLLLVPFVIWFRLLRPSQMKAMVIPDPRIANHSLLDEDHHRKIKRLEEGTFARRAYIFVFGTTIWVSTEGRFVWHYGAIFESFKYRYQWFPLLDLGQVLGMCIFASWQTSTKDACLVRNLLITLVLLLYFLGVLLLRPYLAMFENIISTIIALLMLIAMIIMTVAMAMDASTKRDDLYGGAGVILVVITFLVAFKALYDLVTFVWDMKIGRRRKVQESDLHRLIAGLDDDALEDMKGNEKVVELLEVQGRERRLDPVSGDWASRDAFSNSGHDNQWDDAPVEQRVDTDGKAKPYSGFVASHPTTQEATAAWEAALSSMSPRCSQEVRPAVPAPIVEVPSSNNAGLEEPLLPLSVRGSERTDEEMEDLSELATDSPHPLSADHDAIDVRFGADDFDERGARIARSRGRRRNGAMRSSLPIGFYADLPEAAVTHDVHYNEQSAGATDEYFTAVPFSMKRQRSSGGAQGSGLMYVFSR